mgnify:CR=1 FL=1
MRRRLATACWALALLVSAAAAQEAPEPGSQGWAEQALEQIAQAEQRLQRLDPDAVQQATFNEIRQTGAGLASGAEACIASTTEELTAVTERLETLGEPTEGEAAEAGATRRELQATRAKAEARQASCRLVLVQARELARSAQQRAQAVMAARLLAQGPHLAQVLDTAAREPGQWLAEARASLRENTGLPQLLGIHGAVLGTLMASGLLLGWLAARLVRPSRGPWVADCVAGGACALRAATACWLAALLPLLGASLYLGLATRPDSMVALASYGLSAWLILLVLTNTVLHPPPPARLILNIPQILATSLGRRVKVLLLLVLVGYLLFVVLPEKPSGATHLLVSRAVYGAVLAVNLAWIIGLTRHLLGGWQGALLRLGGLLLAVGALLAEWAGYRNLAQYILLGLLGSLTAWAGGQLLTQFFGDLFDGLDEGRLPWQKTLRSRIGLTAQQHLPGSPWLRALATLAVWGAAVYLILLSWGLSQEGLAVILGWITEGFSMGEARVVPAQIIAAVLMFALLSTVVRWLRQQVVPGWLQRTQLDRGAREAVVTISGYLGFAIAALVALSMAGINFAGLAIVAGALSVGIGFGLQNIVNNFVSGLILLFERPIRKGDWIVVGQTEGYVRQISIRSTRLETFDRSEVIIPNSELATTQVTNLQLRDSWGRIILPVPVAYGSELEKVRELLIKVADEHPDTMRGVPSVPDPVVLFLGYGENTLNFELRLFIPQIDMRLYVITDLYFAIDRELRAAGIHVPIPQRDIYLHRGQRRADVPLRDAKVERPGGPPSQGSEPDGGPAADT